MGGAGGGLSSGDITVYVVALTGLPEIGAQVVVNDASGAIVLTTVTGPDGKAHVDVPPGGLVAHYPYGPKHQKSMQAVVDPPSGSTITLFSYGKSTPQVETTTFHVTMSGYPQATAKLVLLDCASAVTVQPQPGGVTTADVDDAQCLSPTNRILATAYDGANQPIAWGVVDDVAASPGGVADVAVSLDQSVFQTFVDTIAPLDATVTNVGIWMLSRGVQPYFFYMSGAVLPAASASFTFTTPATPIGFMVWENVGYQIAGLQYYAGRTRTYASLPAAVTFDPTTLARVDVSPIDLTDPVHPVFTWSVGPGPIGDIVSVGMTGYDADYQITMAAGSATSFRMPDVPAALPEYQPDYNRGGLPYTWHGAVAIADQEDAAAWEEYNLFQGGIFAPAASTVSSSGSLP